MSELASSINPKMLWLYKHPSDSTPYYDIEFHTDINQQLINMLYLRIFQSLKLIGLSGPQDIFKRLCDRDLDALTNLHEQCKQEGTISLSPKFQDLLLQSIQALQESKTKLDDANHSTLFKRNHWCSWYKC